MSLRVSGLSGGNVMRLDGIRRLGNIGAMLVVLACGQSAWAAVSGLGTFTLDGGTSVPISQGGSVSGRYVAADGGGTGRFTLTMNVSNGYTLPATVTGGSNGLMIFNDQNNNSNDKFSYTLSLTPDNPTLINTVKITQTPTGYSQVDGNSELARQTLSYTNDAATGGTALAIVANNPTVPLFYNAMGDMFMGQDNGATTGVFGANLISTILYSYGFTSNASNMTNQPQLRTDSTNNFYYYRLPDFTPTNGRTDARSTSYGKNNTVTFFSKSFVIWNTISDVNLTYATIAGTVPNNPLNLTDLIALTTSAKPAALSEGSKIASGSSYLSYGVKNTDSQYVISVNNPKTVTLAYQGIMTGSSADYGAIKGETYKEWITFGIESTAPKYYIAGKVFNDTRTYALS
ncbi:hypothetical protein ACF3NV_06860 [Moraxella atlantae]|uniref:hypothetical protein n=1 Tax=Faucicola atlantae TaxID=34059 RepID=UPI003750433A